MKIDGSGKARAPELVSEADDDEQRDQHEKGSAPASSNHPRTDPVTGDIVNGANGFPVPTLGPEGTLTAFYGNPRQVFATLTFSY